MAHDDLQRVLGGYAALGAVALIALAFWARKIRLEPPLPAENHPAARH